MSENAKNIITLCISVYAAAISTIMMIYNIYDSKKDRESKLKINFDALCGQIYIQDHEGNIETIKGATVLNITIVNCSKKVKYINKPQLKLSYDINSSRYREVNLFGIKKQEVWPVVLNSEQSINLKYPFRDNTEWFLKNYPKDAYANIMITDTLGEKYFSEKIQMKVIEDIIRDNKSIDYQTYQLSIENFC